MSLMFGFEVEAFCLEPVKKQPILVPDRLPKDECGWLVEARSEPHKDVRKAIWLLRAELEVVGRQAAAEGVYLLQKPLMKISRDLKVEAARKYGKGLLRYRNLYGHQNHPATSDWATASLHVSVTNQSEFHYKNDVTKKPDTFRFQGFIDYAQLIVRLDKAFAQEIKKAKRNPGFYEVKYDGRIEYRSLPNNVNLDKLTNVLEGISKHLTV